MLCFNTTEYFIELNITGTLPDEMDEKSQVSYNNDIIAGIRWRIQTILNASSPIFSVLFGVSWRKWASRETEQSTGSERKS